MRKFQRVAVVAAALAGLSALGAGVSFAHGDDHDGGGFGGVNAVANSQANAVADFDGADGGGKRHGGGSDGASYFAPENGYQFDVDAPSGK
jgi:uncharacterized membrane protein